jgi:hypothetical protein
MGHFTASRTGRTSWCPSGQPASTPSGRASGCCTWGGSTPTHLGIVPETSSVSTSVTACRAELTPSQQQQLAAGTLSLDSLTRAFIRERLAYRFITTADGIDARKLQEAVRRGALSADKPYMNPLR